MTTFDELVRSGNFLILDTETTGLNEGEIVQIAIIDSSANVLLDTLVKPYEAIPHDATRIHGINDSMVANSPTWPKLIDKIKYLLEGKNLIVYNALYDRRMMHQTAECWGLPKTEWKELCHWFCAMEAYAAYHGEYNSYRGSFKWQKLIDACCQMGIEVNGAHSALGDCLMTLAVVKAMVLQNKNATH